MNIVFAEPLGMCECILNKQVENLKREGHTITFYSTRDEHEDVMIERAKEADILVLSNIPLSKTFFDNCPKLKMISVAFTGVDHIDLTSCRERGITVCNAAGYSTQAVAELSIGMMLAVYRKIVGGDTITRISEDRQGFLGCELHGKTVGIIGLGAIGQRVAQLANAFGCKVLGYNRSQKNIAQVTQVDKDQLLSQSDIITLHLPLTAETRHFIDEADFQLMRPHSILINTARGAIVNQNALYNALRKGQIAGAAVDVYDQEPPLPANFELFNAPNLLMLPHIGYATKEAFAIRLGIVIKNVEMWLAGTPQNLIA
jgi:D-3-phosphoglycerate dehydrogenase